MYIDSILWFLSWPLLIIISYFLIKWALRVIEKNHNLNKERGIEGLSDGGKERKGE